MAVASNANAAYGSAIIAVQPPDGRMHTTNKYSASLMLEVGFVTASLRSKSSDVVELLPPLASVLLSCPSLTSCQPIGFISPRSAVVETRTRAAEATLNIVSHCDHVSHTQHAACFSSQTNSKRRHRPATAQGPAARRELRGRATHTSLSDKI